MYNNTKGPGNPRPIINLEESKNTDQIYNKKSVYSTISDGVKSEYRSAFQDIHIDQNDPLIELLNQCKIDPDSIYSKPPIALQLLENNEPFTIGTLGNFSCFIGKAKSRKTFLVSMCLAAASSGTLMGKIHASTAQEGKKVILFDTEQANYKVWEIVQRVSKLAKMDKAPLFTAYGLRKIETSTRVEMIEKAIYQDDNIGIVVIDGIRDLVHDINNAEEATKIVSKLLKWTEERNIHIITVLHQNKGDNNARGHLGTEIVNKAETIISITKDTSNSDISIVEAEMCREKEFAPFAFTIHESLPIILEGWNSAKEKSGKPKCDPYEFTQEIHLDILEKVFRDGPLKHGQLLPLIKDRLRALSLKPSDSKTRDFFSYYVTNGYITKSGKDRDPQAHYIFSKSVNSVS